MRGLFRYPMRHSGCTKLCAMGVSQRSTSMSNLPHAANPPAGPDAAQVASAPAAQLDALRSELEAGLSELIQGHLLLLDGLAADAMSSGAAGQVRSIVSLTSASDPSSEPATSIFHHILGGHIKESVAFAETWRREECVRYPLVCAVVIRPFSSALPASNDLMADPRRNQISNTSAFHGV